MAGIFCFCLEKNTGRKVTGDDEISFLVRTPLTLFFLPDVSKVNGKVGFWAGTVPSLGDGVGGVIDSNATNYASTRSTNLYYLLNEPYFNQPPSWGRYVEMLCRDEQ